MVVADDDAEVTRALDLALAAVEPTLMDLVALLAGQTPRALGAELADSDTEQLLHGLTTLVREALDGPSREKRRFILDTAIPGMLAHGDTALTLVESHVAFFTLLGHRLLQAVPDELQTAAARWLATFFAEYVREVTETALAVEREA